MDEPYFIRPGEGERIEPSGHRVLAELPHIEALEISYGPDFEGVDPHTHPDHTDSFYVLGGSVHFQLGDEEIVAGPGSFVAAPPGVGHGFMTGPAGARMLNVHAPSTGFHERLRAMG